MIYGLVWVHREGSLKNTVSGVVRIYLSGWDFTRLFVYVFFTLLLFIEIVRFFTPNVTPELSSLYPGCRAGCTLVAQLFSNAPQEEDEKGYDKRPVRGNAHLIEEE